MTDFGPAIKKTGFCLEHRATMMLRKRGWSVIDNRYYVDDQSGAVREIDLVAYRAYQVGQLFVYTVLLISCKKSDQNAWALLSRPVHRADPNVDRRPIHIWTNVDTVNWMLQSNNWRTSYFDILMSEETPRTVLDSDQDVFAFQEINKTNGTAQNDKAIFSSITSLIKAQAYELGLLPNRKKEPSIYQFNLVSLLDGELVRLEFASEDDEITESDIPEELYFFDYIVNKHRTTARIHFVRESYFINALTAYEKISTLNVKFVENLTETFYQDVITNPSKRHLLQRTFDKRVRSTVLKMLRRHGVAQKEYIQTEIYTINNEEDVCVHVILKEGPSFEIDDSDTCRVVGLALQEIYHFSGSFKVEVNDIPF
jgi:hypothetical protein